MELVINFLPLITMDIYSFIYTAAMIIIDTVIVVGVGLLIFTIIMIIIEKVSDFEAKNFNTVQIILLILVIFGTVGISKYRDIHISQNNNDSNIDVDDLAHNGYTVYIDGSVVDIDKIIISDYPNDKIYVNDELKEIYISSSN